MGRGVTVRRRAQAVVRAKLVRVRIPPSMRRPAACRRHCPHHRHALTPTHSLLQERSNYAVLPPAPAPDAPDKLPRSLRKMLAVKAADDARAARKAAAKQAAAAHKAGVPEAPAAPVAAAPVVVRPSPPPRPAAPKPPPAPAAPPSSRKAKRRERSKALKAAKKAAKKRGRDASDDDSDDDRPAFGETADAPIQVTLKSRHWNDATRLGAMFERQLAAAKARAEGGVTAADRAAVIEAYRARKGGTVGSATRTSLKQLVAAGAARAASAADAKRTKKR